MKYGSKNVVEVKVKLIVDESTVWMAWISCAVKLIDNNDACVL
jgi:hypothetical protein